MANMENSSGIPAIYDPKTLTHAGVFG